MTSQESVSEPITAPQYGRVYETSEEIANPQRAIPPAPKPRISGSIYNNVPRKTCAAEVLNWLKGFKNITLGAIAAPFLVLLADRFNFIAAVAVTFAVMAPGIFYLYKINKEIVRLGQEYNIR